MLSVSVDVSSENNQNIRMLTTKMVKNTDHQTPSCIGTGIIVFLLIFVVIPF
jgi:hypothetical protein